MLKYSPDPVLRKLEAESVRRNGTFTPENSAKFFQMFEEGKVALYGANVVVYVVMTSTT